MTLSSTSQQRKLWTEARACLNAPVVRTPTSTRATVRDAIELPRVAALGAQAFVYGYPLSEFLRTRAEMTRVARPDRFGNAPVNALSNAGGFARPETRIVVAPNVDTLYSIAHLDLSEGPIFLGHPEMGARYFMFQLLDPYTNAVGYIGSRTTGSRARRFAIVWKEGPKGELPAGTPRLEVDYQRIWLLGRTLATGAADEAAAQALMAQYELTPPGGRSDFRHGPPTERTKASKLSGIAWLDALSAAMEANPPPARDAPMLSKLAVIGVGPGLRVADAKLGNAARRVLDASVRALATALPKLAKARQYATALGGGGWTTPASNIGDFGTDYVFRAGVAALGLGANTPEEAAYKAAFFDSRSRPLNGKHRYRLRFGPGEAPPADAFWSITVYDSAGFLVPNASELYALGSHHAGLVRRTDGSIVVVFGTTRPTAHDVNWLPVPASGFGVYLRIYVPRRSVLDGRWRPPAIERID